MIVPRDAISFGNILFVLVICLVLVLIRVEGTVRLLLVIPTVYLAACCWESRLIVNPAITTQIMLGVILIVTMAARPNGLLGHATRRGRLSGDRRRRLPLLELDKLSLSFGGLKRSPTSTCRSSSARSSA